MLNSNESKFSSVSFNIKWESLNLFGLIFIHFLSSSLYLKKKLFLPTTYSLSIFLKTKVGVPLVYYYYIEFISTGYGIYIATTEFLISGLNSSNFLI